MSRALAIADVDEPEVLGVRVRHVAGVRVLELHGELDYHGAPQLGHALERTGQGIVVDCRACTFADSSGLAALLAGHRRSFQAGNGYALVVEAGSLLGRMLDVTGLVQVLAVYDTLEDALAVVLAA